MLVVEVVVVVVVGGGRGGGGGGDDVLSPRTSLWKVCQVSQVFLTHVSRI